MVVLLANVCCRFGSATGDINSSCSGQCAPGRFGNTTAMVNANCSGPCAPGFACPAGSTNATAVVCPPGQYSLGGAPMCSLCAAGSFCPLAGSTSPAVVTCPYGYACGPGSSNGTSLPCGIGYFCPIGTANATSNKCYASAAVASAWWRHGSGGLALPDQPPRYTMVSATPLGTVLMAGSGNGTDASCNDTLLRLPSAMVAGVGGVGAVAHVLLLDGDGDGNEDVVAVLANGVAGMSYGNRTDDNGSGVSGQALHFPELQTLTVAVRVTFAMAWDSDSDGWVDILTVGTATNGTANASVVSTLWRNSGGGAAGWIADNSSGAAGLLPPLPWPSCAAGVCNVSAAVVDVTGDGLLDVIVGCATGGVALLVRQAGTSSTGAPLFRDETAARRLSPASPCVVAVADVEAGDTPETAATRATVNDEEPIQSDRSAPLAVVAAAVRSAVAGFLRKCKGMPGERSPRLAKPSVILLSGLTSFLGILAISLPQWALTANTYDGTGARAGRSPCSCDGCTYQRRTWCKA